MGKVIAKKIRGLSWWAKFSLITLEALLISVFVLSGLCNPRQAQAASDSPLMHNSTNLGTGYGTWGTDKDCTWCHSWGNTNVKGIKGTIATPTGPKTVIFTRMTTSSNAVNGVMGNDQRTYAQQASTNICEVCHHKTTYHQYSASKVTVDTNHKSANNTECIRCHAHGRGFQGLAHDFPFPGASHKVGLTAPSYGACTTCHSTAAGKTYPDAGEGAPGCTGCHVDATNFNSASAGCQDCHGTNAGGGRPSGSTFPNDAGSHNASGHSGLDCATCHNGAGSGAATHGSSGRLPHGPADVTLSFSGAAGTVGTYSGPVDKTCTAVNCHDDGTGNKVESPMWGSTVPMCTACHLSRPMTGSHTPHLNGANVACASCHKGAVESTTYPLLHANNVIDVYKTTAGDLGYPTAKAKGSPYTTCTTALCHTDPSNNGQQKISPTWGDSSQPKCSYCHASRPTTGSHNAHFNTGFAHCGNCHAGAVENTTLSASHNNNVIDVYMSTPGDMGYPQAKAVGSAYGKCSSGSCHTDGRGNNVLSPLWGTSNNDCSACHANLPPTGSHAQHITGVGVTCGRCHKGAIQGTTPPILHNSGYIDVYQTSEGDYGYPARKTIGSAFTSCTTANCHGRLSPVWGSNTTNYQCTKCHGKGTVLANYSTVSNVQAAPGYAGVGIGVGRQVGTISSNVSNDPKVGAHDSHLRALNNLGHPTLCSDCHTVPATAFVSGHMDGSSLPTWSNMAKNVETIPGSATPYTYTKGALATNYNSVSGSCSNVYCHGGSLTDGTGTSPVWNDGSYLTGNRSTDCAKCHGYPPVNSTRYPHSPSVDFMTCTNCHPHDGNRSSTDPLLGNDFHINGRLEANKHCDTCHDYDTRGTNGTLWGKSQMGVESFGAHAMHINYLKQRMNVTSMNANLDVFGTANYNGICGVCHSRLESNHQQNNRTTSLRNITFGDASSVKRQFGPNPPTYNGTTYVSSGTTPKTCSNLDCHYKKSPIWQPY
jgi:predicted CxxxxCH...CXXCH cytochrome family protein